MYYIRYALTLAFEILEAWPGTDIQALGYGYGSWGAYWALCKSSAHYSARWKHPLKYCVCRKWWLQWMMGERQ